MDWLHPICLWQTGDPPLQRSVRDGKRVDCTQPGNLIAEAHADRRQAVKTATCANGIGREIYIY